MRVPGNKQMLWSLLKKLQWHVENFFGRVAMKFSSFAQIPLNFREDTDLQQNFMLPMQLWNFVHRVEHADKMAGVRDEELASISKETIPNAMPRKMLLEGFKTRCEFYGRLSHPLEGPHPTEDEENMEMVTDLLPYKNALRLLPDHCTTEEKQYFLKGLRNKWGDLEIMDSE